MPSKPLKRRLRHEIVLEIRTFDDAKSEIVPISIKRRQVGFVHPEGEVGIFG